MTARYWFPHSYQTRQMVILHDSEWLMIIFNNIPIKAYIYSLLTLLIIHHKSDGTSFTFVLSLTFNICWFVCRIIWLIISSVKWSWNHSCVVYEFLVLFLGPGLIWTIFLCGKLWVCWNLSFPWRTGLFCTKTNKF